MTQMAAAERRQGERGHDAGDGVQEPREDVAAQREGDGEEEVLEPLLLSPERPRRAHESTGQGVQPGVDEVVLLLVAADRRREPGRCLDEEEQSAGGEEEPRRPPARRTHRTQRGDERRAAGDQRECARAGERHGTEPAGRGERQPEDADQPEPRGEARQQVLIGIARQRARRTESEQAGRGAGGEHQQREDQVDHSGPRR